MLALFVGLLACGPQATSTSTSTFEQVAVDYGTICAKDVEDSLSCWGDAVEDVPTERVRDFDLAWDGGCAVLEHGAARCWSSSGDSHPYAEITEAWYAEVALSSAPLACWNPETGPVDCVLGSSHDIEDWAPPTTHLAAIDGGYSGFCGLDDAGEITCWGGFRVHSPRLPELERPIQKVVAGFDAVCALDAAGHVACEDGRGRESWSPDTCPPGDASKVCRDVAMGDMPMGLGLGDTVCVVAADGRAACEDTCSHPPDDSVLRGPFRAISQGYIGRGPVACAALEDGGLTCWGVREYDGTEDGPCIVGGPEDMFD